MSSLLFTVNRRLKGGNGVIVSATEGVLGLDESQTPFNQLDWPNPQRKEFILIDIGTRPLNDETIAFNQTDWPNPRKNVTRPITWINDNQLNVLVPIISNPIVPVEWDNPGRKEALIIGTTARQADDFLVAFNQLDWPNPRNKGKNNPGFALAGSINLGTIQAVPFVPIEFRNPDLKKQNNLGFLNSRPQYYNDLTPNNQYDWPNPGPRKLKEATWAVNLLQSTLAPPPGPAPFSTVEFNLPNRRERLIVDISSSIILSPSTQPPFTGELDIPAAKRRLGLNWNQSRPFYYSDIKPFLQQDYPIAKSKPKLLNTWISNIGQSESLVEYMPCSTLDYPNPPRKKAPAITWISQISQLQQLFTSPVGSQIYGNPTLRVKQPGHTWIQPRPSYFIDVITQLPFAAVTAILPVRRIFTPGFIGKPQIIQPIIGNPAKQIEWPNPARKKLPNVGYEFFYQQDDNNPASTQYTAIPPAKYKVSLYGWISSIPNIAINADPINTSIYPNFLPVKRHTQSIVNNLLPQLFPGVGEVPFYQNEWPNPLKGKNNFHSGWLQPRQAFYVEPSIFISQNEWPVFRSRRRNDVGYIAFKIPSETPRFNTVDSIVLRQKPIARSYIYTSLYDLLATTGLIPFHQNDWPLPVRRRVNYQILSILKGLDINLPLIVGRSICMISDATEYYLISEELDYQLNSQATEYDLDSGGSECQ